MHQKSCCISHTFTTRNASITDMVTAIRVMPMASIHQVKAKSSALEACTCDSKPCYNDVRSSNLIYEMRCKTCACYGTSGGEVRVCPIVLPSSSCSPASLHLIGPLCMRYKQRPSQRQKPL